ncbi:MAG: hypothetical protein KBB39_17420 [Phycicoccus sp.]|nr:hypothetical protein [Phycicoccus sp.]
MSDMDIAYAAGVIDSDGYIGVKRSDYAQRVRGDAGQPVYAPRVMVKQVTPEAVTLLHDLFGGYRGDARPSAARGRPLFTWEAHSANAMRACEAVLPHLRIKREQALNAIECGRLNAGSSRRGWDLPDVDPSEPLVPLLEAARRAGRSPDVAYQSAHLGNIPVVREGRRVFVPESYIETWRTRGTSAPRRAALTERMHACFLRAKELNRVGV